MSPVVARQTGVFVGATDLANAAINYDLSSLWPTSAETGEAGNISAENHDVDGAARPSTPGLGVVLAIVSIVGLVLVPGKRRGR